MWSHNVDFMGYAVVEPYVFGCICSEVRREERRDWASYFQTDVFEWWCL
jgi:hypothetical protein